MRAPNQQVSGYRQGWRTKLACLVAVCALAAAPLQAQQRTWLIVTLPIDTTAPRCVKAACARATGDTARWFPRLRRDGADSVGRFFLGFEAWRIYGSVRWQFVTDSVHRAYLQDGAFVDVDAKAQVPAPIGGGGAALSVSSWGTKALKADTTLQAHAWSGLGARVGVIDEGIDYSHPDLPLDGGIQPGIMTADSLDYSPCGDHGEHVAGTATGLLTGVAPSASLWSIRVGQTTNCVLYLSGVFYSALWACTNRMDVVNISLGFGYGQSMDATIANATACGVTVVAAAGNDGLAALMVPASAPTALAVCAWDGGGGIAGFSNHAPNTFCAPGVGITSTLPNGGYGDMSGTSMATPHVTGVVARIKGWWPEIPADTLRQVLCAGALPIPNGGCGALQLDGIYAALVGRGLPTAAPIVPAPCAAGATCTGCFVVNGTTPFKVVAYVNRQPVPWITFTYSGRTACYAAAAPLGTPAGTVPQFQLVRTS